MKNLRKIIVILILIVLGVSYYYYLSNRTIAEEEKLPEETKVSEVLIRDLDKNYPPSPKEVVKFYSSIMECYYGEEYTEEQLVQLADKARQLMDEELLNNNPEDQFLKDLKNEIEKYKKAKREIFASYVSSADEVEYFTYNKEDWAKVDVVYSMREDSNYFKTYEEYVLRKDKDGNYKIFGWYLTETDDSENEE